MNIETKYFGQVEVAKEQISRFPRAYWDLSYIENSLY